MDKKEVTNLFDTQEARVMYNAQGQPEFLMIPIRSKSVYNVSEEEIVDAVREVRKDVYEYMYGTFPAGAG